jgi:hypothetical protein
MRSATSRIAAPHSPGATANLARRESVGSISSAEYKALGTKKPSKFKNKWDVVDGIKFQSKREARRYVELVQLQTAGAISGLRLQVRFPLHVNGELITTYVCDFQYTEIEGGYPKRVVTEDTKGFKTPDYIIKRKLMKALHGIEVKET